MSKSTRSSRSKSRSRSPKKRKGIARRGKSARARVVPRSKSVSPDSGAQLDPVVAKAVRDAQAAAPNDDKAFFDRLEGGVAAALPGPPTGGGALSMGRAGGRTTGARLGDDP